MVVVPTLLAASVLLLWLYLLLGHGGYWRLREWLPSAGARAAWPSVVALVPARDEAETIAATVDGVLGQDYPGEVHLIVVDDQSTDATAEVARRAADTMGAGVRLNIIEGTAPPAGWTGKLWALEQGWQRIRGSSDPPPWLWLTDGDIAHPPDTLRRLVAKGEDDDRDLVSLMVRLVAGGFWGRLLIPTFVYFFRQLFPFAWSNDPRSRTAAAAGGCVLLRRRALESAGGFRPISDRVIDDCALAALVKQRGRAEEGRIWLGMSDGSRSLRPYRGLGDIWQMVARSAYAQLRYSPWLLAGTLVGMGFLYLAAPLLVLSLPWHGDVAAGIAALAGWLVMALSLQPVLRLYQQSPAWGAALPLAAVLYAAMTVDSARRHAAGRGGWWKGRAQGARHTSVTQR